MAGMPRESSFMPTIKCSTCGLQVEISMMGEHICAGAGGGSADAPPAPGLLGSLLSFAKPQAEKPIVNRVPPRVDTSAANRSYITQGQLTPVSISSGSRSVSPKTPIGRPGAGRADDYFAPKIANEYDSPPQQSRRPGGYGGFGDSDGFEVDQTLAANSPKKAVGLLQRMNTIAPGPFEANRRPGAARNAFPARNNSMKSPREMAPPTNVYVTDRPSTSGSANATGNIAPPKFPRKNGYGGFGPPQRSAEDFEPKPFGMNNRSETFPRPSEAGDAPARTPSAPGPRPDRLRRPSNTSNDPMGRVPPNGERSRRPSAGMGPDTTRPPPPRTSLVRPRTSGRDGSVSTPAINLAEEFGVGNPYHSPSASVSSSISGSSQSARPSQPSSRTSPARSLGSRQERKADMSGFDNLMTDLQSSMEGLRPKNLPSVPVQPPPFDKPLALSAGRAAAPRADVRYDAAAQGRRTQPRSRSPLASPSWDTSGRDDPAVQGGLRNVSPTIQRPHSPRLPSSPEQPRTGTASRSRDPALQPTRGDCKACGLAIRGKSISSADGRLTGRYHKACFVCTTCTKPFPSSTFYVINDAPYCELHYHKLNGSLCGSCGIGIEGQYLEDESVKKYHPGCFRCGDCGKVLQDGYFEVNGQAFCERDAWRRVQQPWISNAASGSLGDGSKPSNASPRLGLPAGPGGRLGPASRPFGLPSGNKLGPRPRMEKRMTRLGMM